MVKIKQVNHFFVQEIYAGVVPQFPLSLEELMEFRRDHIGTPEDAVRDQTLIDIITEFIKNEIYFFN